MIKPVEEQSLRLRLDELDRLKKSDGLRSEMVVERIKLNAKLFVLRHNREEALSESRA